MNAEQTTQTVDQQIPTAEQVEEQPEALSIEEHRAQFGPDAQKAEPDERLPHRSDTQKRDQGKFAPGHKRTPRNDWQAKVDQLTSRVKTHEERATKAESELAATRAELERLKSSGASAQTVQRQEQRVERAEAKVERQEPTKATSTFTDPRPKEDDAKYEGDYAAFLADLSEWSGRKAYHEARESERQREAQEKADRDFEERHKAAVAKYPDFDDVTDRVFARIPKGSTLERIIYADREYGDDVLYYFDSHPQELDAILRMPTPVEQFRAVTLLAHNQFASKRSGPAAETASAAERRQWKPPSPPPNAVRTEAQRTSETPPPTDGSLSIAEHRKQFGPKRR